MNFYEKVVENVVRELFGENLPAGFRVILSRTDEKFGDYSTNVAMQLTKILHQNPREIAEKITQKLRETNEFESCEIAGAGFINLTISAQNLAKNLDENFAKGEFLHPEIYKNQETVTEFSDPNPFKVLHIGHLYTSIVGDAISNLIENAGAQKVHRVNFGGDVGLHVAKNLWAIREYFGGEFPEKLNEIPDNADARAEFLAQRYVEGNRAYDENETAKNEITKINSQVYDFHKNDDHKSPLAQIYWACREWSYDYFDNFYAKIGVKFEKYYPESSVAELGLAKVRENVPKVYEKSAESDAIIFPGEKYDLHTRVFINSNGLPTYEAKDIGLSFAKWRDYHFDKSVIITGNDIIEYMKVVLKSISLFAPELSSRTLHLTHGNVKLAGGVKMSSRLGNFVRAVDVLNLTAVAQEKESGSRNDAVILGAIKFAFLKNNIGPDVIFEPETSVSLVGNSGPYVQYAAVRVNKILRDNPRNVDAKPDENYNYKDEKNLILKLLEYPEIVRESAKNLEPHRVANYVYELAKDLNKYYENTPVATKDVPPEIREIRLEFLAGIAAVFAHGLKILGIEIPEKM